MIAHGWLENRLMDRAYERAGSLNRETFTGEDRFLLDLQREWGDFASLCNVSPSKLEFTHDQKACWPKRWASIERKLNELFRYLVEEKQLEEMRRIARERAIRCNKDPFEGAEGWRMYLQFYHVESSRKETFKAEYLAAYNQ